MTTPLFTFEPLNESNIHIVPKLIQVIFDKIITVESVRHKYNTTYTGVSAVGILAFDQNKTPVAFQGFIPCRFKMGAAEEIGIQSCDSLVLKEFRGHNLYAQLLKHGAKIANEAGATFAYGFANQNSLPIVTKEGWSPNGQMKRFVIPTGAIPLSKVAQKLRINKLFQWRIAQLLRPFAIKNTDQFENSNTALLCPKYDAVYLKYKAFNAAHCIQIGNSILMVKADAHLHVGLIRSPSLVAMEKVIKTLVRASRKAGISNIVFQLDGGSIEAELLSKKYAPAKSWTICYLQNNSTFPLDQISLSGIDIDSF